MTIPKAPGDVGFRGLLARSVSAASAGTRLRLIACPHLYSLSAGPNPLTRTTWGPSRDRARRDGGSQQTDARHGGWLTLNSTRTHAPLNLLGMIYRVWGGGSLPGRSHPHHRRLQVLATHGALEGRAISEDSAVRGHQVIA